jgi:predicted acetyltransferase
MSFTQKNDKYLIIDGIIGNIDTYKFHTISLKDNEIKYKEEEYTSVEKTIKINDDNNYYFLLNFICPQKGCYTNIIQIFYYSNNYIKKIYQNYDDETINLKYLNELSKLKYLSDQDTNELFIADKLHKTGYHIASYVYLRRVLENIFNNLYEKNKSAIDINDNSTFDKKHMKDKLKLIKSYLPELVNSMESNNKYSQIYKILSEGIHKLDENIAAKYYKLIRQVIIMILERIRDNEEKEKNVSKIDNAFNEIFNINKSTASNI